MTAFSEVPKALPKLCGLAMVHRTGLVHLAKLHCCTLQAHVLPQLCQVWAKQLYHISEHPEAEQRLQITQFY